MIAVRNLAFSYRSRNGAVPALADVAFEVDSGTICAVMGPSGCGKSTLISILAGLERPLSGTVSIAGLPVDPARQRIALVPQQYGLLPWKTVERNVLLGFTIRRGSSPGMDRNEAIERAGTIMEELGIESLKARYPASLSGGQRQRVALARAYAFDPDVLLFDEPFSALDAITREDMQGIFLRFWRRHPVTALFVTHSVSEAVSLASRIVVLTPGPAHVLRVEENPFFLQSEADRAGILDFEESLKNSMRGAAS
jgi:ABC-type nitrate/sulfonate/bicarbonate transport system ATPase subunit